ncbi:TPA: hypothetical protein ACHS1O_004196 [Pseudomonas aeruginosa]
MKITNVEWNEGAPEKVLPGMLVKIKGKRGVFLVGHADPDGNTSLVIPSAGVVISGERRKKFARWAWLIQPHELNWLEDMANKHKARAQG